MSPPHPPAPAPEPAVFSIAADHPCLAGHFPGNPIVPGVVILDEVLARLALPVDEPRTLAWVKFARPLLPGQLARIHYAPEAAHVRFSVSHGEHLLVSGVIGGPVRDATAQAPAVLAATRP